MDRIKVKTPVVEFDGGEMTWIICGSIEDRPILPCPALNGPGQVSFNFGLIRKHPIYLATRSGILEARDGTPGDTFQNDNLRVSMQKASA